MKTYISLFSSAGVGCYAFKKEGFECIATNELIERRLNIQKNNKKCKYQTGYICGDITSNDIQQKLYNEIDFWKRTEKISNVDVILATPPCQGMSTANYKKGDETKRNSLVVEAIHIISKIKPRIFIFENVKAFLKTYCVDKDEQVDLIKNCIFKHLGNEYNIEYKVINFMDFGIPSSRPRTLVIGVKKEEKNISPLNLFPLKQDLITVKDVIGDLKSLSYGESDSDDILHSFRVYPQYMQDWIHDLKEGETAFNNSKEKLPYKLVDGKKQILKSGHMGNKFRRMFWNKPAPCITTRNDQLASQTTIHPKDDRVLSIRELMRVMTIPDDFCWVPKEKYNKQIIDKNETLIRQSIGEAVPTNIIWQIAKNINTLLDFDDYVKNPSMDTYKGDNFYIKSYIIEQKLDNAKETGSFYTPQSVVYNTIRRYKNDKKKVRILEPAVGTGAFIPQLLRLLDDCDDIQFDCFDISQSCLDFIKEEISKIKLRKGIHFNFICHDFLTYKSEQKYDLAVTNPPYFKIKAEERKEYKKYFQNVNDNIFCLFLKKMASNSNEILTVIPKTFIMIPDCNDIRKVIEETFNIVSVYDYGVHSFKTVFIEIISIHLRKNYHEKIYIRNCLDNTEILQDQDYIFGHNIWLLYRNEWFDSFISKLTLDVFDFYRDRQLTNKYLLNEGKVWVLRSKNLLDDGTFVHKEGYDKYVDSLEGFYLKKYINSQSIVFTNFTYNTRASILPSGCVVNGSFCILLKKKEIGNIDLNFYSTEEFRKYYAIIKNKSKFTINLDSNSIYYIGVLENDK